MTIDAVALGKPIIGDSEAGFNIVKFMLSVFSMVFDLIFMFQHFVLYRSAWKDRKEHKSNMKKLTESMRAMSKDENDETWKLYNKDKANAPE